MMTGALSGALGGTTVLDIGTQTPGRFATHLLGELGADVVRIERPGTPAPGADDEALLLDRGKRTVVLDLADPGSRAGFDGLVAGADVLVHTYRPATAARLGLDGPRLLATNPRLVVCGLSGFGEVGGAGDRPAYDLLVLAATGMLDALYCRRDAPVPQAYLSDAVSGVVAAFAAVTALTARARDGQGRALDLAMADAVFGLLAVSHGTRRAGLATPAFDSPLYATYPTAAGGAVALAALRRSSCEALFAGLGRPDLAADAWRGTDPGSVGAFLRDTFATRPAGEWVALLGPHDVEVVEVRSVAEAFDDPVLRARHMVVDVTLPGAGPATQVGQVGQVTQVGHPLQAGHPPRPPRPSP